MYQSLLFLTPGPQHQVFSTHLPSSVQTQTARRRRPFPTIPLILPMVPSTKRPPEHTLRQPHYHMETTTCFSPLPKWPCWDPWAVYYPHVSRASSFTREPLRRDPLAMASRILEPPEEIVEEQEGGTEEEVTWRTNISSSSQDKARHASTSVLS